MTPGTTITLEERVKELENNVFGPKSGGPGLFDRVCDVEDAVNKLAAALDRLRDALEKK